MTDEEVFVRAANLMYTGMLTRLGQEFPELQFYIVAVLAREQGEDENVVNAIMYQHEMVIRRR